MMFQTSLRQWIVVIVVFWIGTHSAQAQNNNGGNNNGGFNFAGGIKIDANGVVALQAPIRESVAAAKKRKQSYLKANLPESLTQSSEVRRISLRQLDGQLSALIQDQKEIPLELRFLAGITRIDEVIVDRQENDLAIIGPAEGFAPDLQGRMRGVVSGRPVLNLEDLLVAWRTVQGGTTSVLCSIDPTPEGVAAFNAYASQNQVATSPAAVAKIFDNMARQMGRQVVTLNGVPRDCHFAMVLVEADLRMKRIALGKDPSGVKGVPSHLQFMRTGDGSLTRWWFVPLYDPIGVSEDRSRFQLSGQRLQLLGQDEYTNFQGERSAAPSNKLGTTKFVKEFTDHIPQLAETHPAFAELQNLFDWMVVCTLIERQKLTREIDWRPLVLGDPQALPVTTCPVPEGVDAVGATNQIGRTTFGLVGGVTLNADSVVAHTAPVTSTSLKPIPQRNSSRAWSD